jgi:hypothetical protein
MLSHGLRQVLEALPGRIPLVIEVLDRSLLVVVPESSYRPFPLLDLTGELRQQLLADNSTRPHTIHQRGQRIDVYPIGGPGDRTWTMLLAMGAEESEIATLNAWGPILRSALEADLATVGEVNRHSQQSRHLGAVLRFIGYIAGTHSDNELLRAILQAAAVWFDLDARIYRREPGGDFVPHIHLPGTIVVPQKRIPAAIVDAVTDILRMTSVADLEQFGLSGEGAALIPIGGPRADLLLVLAGPLPPDIDVTFGTIAKVTARILESGRRRAPVVEGKPLIAAFTEPAVSAEQTFTRLLRSLVDTTGAAGGSVTARVRDESRVIVSLGEVEGSGAASEHLSLTGTGGAELSVTVDLVPGEGARFDAAARAIVDHGGDLLRVWLSGPGSRDAVRRAVWGARADRTAAFVTRIEEEIARAKRFHLDLALIVVRTEAEEDAGRMEELQKYVRAELRDSDVLAPINNVEIAALLIHTDNAGGEAVVRRLQRRLTDDPSWKTAASVGHATFSPECATPSALLAAARIPAAPSRAQLSIVRDSSTAG